MATSSNSSINGNPSTILDHQEESVAALHEPEEISEETVASLQVASGIRVAGLDMTIFVLQDRLCMVLDQAWRVVRQTLDVKDLWTTAQAARNISEGSGVGLDCLERSLGESSEEWGVDPEGARKLLPKVQTWNLVTRWAVVRAVNNSVEAAKKRSANGHVIPNRLIEDEFRKVLAA